MINKERLAETFRFLVEIDSVSKEEGEICLKIQKIIESMGAETFVDHAAAKTGSDTGNLIARIPGNTYAPPLLLNAHMDTVEPGRGIRPVFSNGLFTSDGSTILGADCKSSIAIILEILRVLQEHNLPHGPLEIVFTVCEEIGLLGAKNLDFSLLSSPFGYVLDGTDINGLVTQAPSSNRLEFIVHGKDAHAGAAPEKGINAIHIASKAIAGLQLGRIDPETTCNIGVIEGGRAANIVPNRVIVKGEVRSHDSEKLALKTDEIVTAFQKAVDMIKPEVSTNGLPRLDYSVELDFAATRIMETDPVVMLAKKAASNLGRTLKTKMTGGGADANVFFSRGIMTGVLGTGMSDMHSLRESVLLDDMVKSAELVLEIIQLHSKESPH
jgi:tripeptide aminopeptidase